MSKKFKVLLLNPPSFDAITMEREDISFDDYGRYPPLGLLYIASYLKKSDLAVDVTVMDSNILDWHYDDFEGYFKKERPDLVGLGSFTPSIFDVFSTLELIKKCLPDTITVVGGTHTTLYPEETIANKDVDFVVAGEGEIVFKKLVEKLINEREDFNEIEGVSYKNDGKVFLSEKRAFIKDLDILPHPDRTLLDFSRYTCVVGKQAVLATVMSTRGCPNKCTYCNSPSSGYRYRSAANIIDELEDIRKLGINEILFFDDLFNLNKKNVFELCRIMKEREMKFSWSFRGTIAGVDDKFLKIIKDAGCERIQFGIETSTDEALRKLKKKLTVEKIINVVNLCKENKVTTVGNFLIGLPDDTEEAIQHTFDFAESLPLDYVQYSVLIPYPGTEVYEEGLRTGFFSNDFWREFARKPVKDFEPKVFDQNVSRDRLFELMKKGFKSFYFRPRHVIKTMLELRSFTEFMKKVSGFRTLLKL